MKKFASTNAEMMEMCMCSCQMCMVFRAFISDMSSISMEKHFAA
ncbi:MAG: hypothetical protein ACI4XJ_09715 [Eubacteriales bacterium]